MFILRITFALSVQITCLINWIFLSREISHKDKSKNNRETNFEPTGGYLHTCWNPNGPSQTECYIIEILGVCFLYIIYMRVCVCIWYDINHDTTWLITQHIMVDHNLQHGQPINGLNEKLNTKSISNSCSANVVSWTQNEFVALWKIYGIHPIPIHRETIHELYN